MNIKTNFKQPKIIDLVNENHPNIFSKEIDGISNSLSQSKCLWNEDAVFSYPVNSNLDVNIISDSNQDTATGTGAKTIRIIGLVHSLVNGINTYTDKFVDMDLNGTNLVAVTNGSFYRVLKVEVIAFGSGAGLKNQGNIKVSINNFNSLIMNCIKQYDNISNSLIICPSSSNSMILDKININAYFHTATELIFKILNVDGSEKQFQKIYLNSNTSYLKIPIRKLLKEGQTFYLELNPLETIIGTNNISCILSAYNIDGKRRQNIIEQYPNSTSATTNPT